MHCSQRTPAAAAAAAAAVVVQVLTQQLPAPCAVAAEGKNRKDSSMHKCNDDTVPCTVLELPMISSAVPTSNSCIQQLKRLHAGLCLVP
jgi:hypothetical protein